MLFFIVIFGSGPGHSCYRVALCCFVAQCDSVASGGVDSPLSADCECS